MEQAIQQPWHANIPSRESLQKHYPAVMQGWRRKDCSLKVPLKLAPKPTVHALACSESPARWNRTTSRLRLDGFEVRPQHQLGSSRHLVECMRPWANRRPTKTQQCAQELLQLP